MPALPAASSLLGAAGAASLLRNTAAGQALSPQMLSFSFCLTLSNVGLMPAESPVYELVARSVLPLSAALGLLAGARLESEERSASSHLAPMLVAFAVGSLGSILGAFSAFGVAGRCGWSSAQAACAAACLCATYARSRAEAHTNRLLGLPAWPARLAPAPAVRAWQALCVSGSPELIGSPARCPALISSPLLMRTAAALSAALVLLGGDSALVGAGGWLRQLLRRRGCHWRSRSWRAAALAPGRRHGAHGWPR